MSPERTCVGCRQRSTQALLLRVSIQGSTLAIGRDRPGRGAWLHPTLACFRLAERRSALGRALRFSGPLDSTDLAAHLEGLDPQAFAL